MKIKKVMNAQSASEARQFAIDWQSWVSGQALSYSELNNWFIVFDALAVKFPELKEDFKENGIL